MTNNVIPKSLKIRPPIRTPDAIRYFQVTVPTRQRLKFEIFKRTTIKFEAFVAKLIIFIKYLKVILYSIVLLFKLRAVGNFNHAYMLEKQRLIIKYERLASIDK